MSDSSLKKGRFTEFSNRIGLYSKQTGNYIANTPEIILNFPFKDTVLEGGMIKEDSKRDERFLHRKIDKKDIDTLEDPKVLTNFKYVDKNGETDLNSTSDIEFFDENGNLKQNLLIKGNNLLALHSLKERLSGQVKLIYIDPPYNTGNDGFKYNDSFNHSSWLTFMKNRLEVAKDLLRDDGAIFISCDDNEQAYLKVLCDEIFGRENFVTQLIWNTKNASKGVPPIRMITSIHEYILVYEKTSMSFRFSGITRTTDDFSNPDNDPRGLWRKEALVSTISKKTFEITDPETGNVFNRAWAFSKESLDKMIAEKRVLFPSSPNGTPLQKKFFNDYTNNEVPITTQLGTFQSRKATSDLMGIFGGRKVFDFPKPEGLIQFIIEQSTKEGDIVLDYHLGSGTTASVAHKLNRKWVGIEQMDYIENVTMKRLREVILGEQGGISKDVNWKGGGSFVYMELKKYNQDFLDRLMEVTSIPDVEAVYEDMQKNAFLKFFFDKKEFEKDENFRSKSWEERRDMLVEILDENQLYLNLQDMRDSKHKVSNDEMVLTDRFYGVNEDAES